MTSWRDRLNQMSGKSRLVVCRLFLQLAGSEVTPLLGVLNAAAREAVEAEGDLAVLGEGLVEICQSLLQHEADWQAAANEGDVFWDEGQADEYLTALFTDSAQRYQGGIDTSFNQPESSDRPLSLPATSNLIVMITVAYEGEVPALETDLANVSALKAGLQALINLHYQESLRAIQVHFSPAQLGDILTADQILEFYPELIPL